MADLSNTRHLPDLVVRFAMPDSIKPPREVFLGGRPDWLGRTLTGYVCFEYENSSRGFVSHVCKYIRIAGNSPNLSFSVTIIGSLHHSKIHTADLMNATAAAKFCMLQNLVFNFAHDDGTGRLIQEFINSHISK